MHKDNISKKIVLILTFTLMAVNSIWSLPPGWQLIDVREEEGGGYNHSEYFEIKCADSLNYMIWNNLLGAGGNIIRRTTNGGLTWKNVYLDSGYFHNPDEVMLIPRLNSVAYPNTKLFIGVGDSGLILRTTDKGDSWFKTTIGKNFRLDMIRMFDEKYGILSCGYLPLPIEKVDLLETEDGGLTWKKMNIPIANDIGYVDINIIRPDLLASIIWYIKPVPKKNLLWLSEHGNKWDTLSIPENNFFMDFINEKQGWICGGYSNSKDSRQTSQEIHYTEDGGKTWTKQRDKKFNGEVLNNIKFFNDKFGVATSCLSLILTTTDGGKNWSENIIEKMDTLSGNFYCLLSPQVPTFKDAIVIMDGDSVFKYTREITDTTSSDIPEMKTNINLYPNPVKDYMTLPKDDKLPNIKIYSLEGILISEFEYNEKIDVSALVPGFYILRLGNKYQKFIKL